MKNNFQLFEQDSVTDDEILLSSEPMQPLILLQTMAKEYLSTSVDSIASLMSQLKLSPEDLAYVNQANQDFQNSLKLIKESVNKKDEDSMKNGAPAPKAPVVDPRILLGDDGLEKDDTDREIERLNKITPVVLDDMVRQERAFVAQNLQLMGKTSGKEKEYISSGDHVLPETVIDGLPERTKMSGVKVDAIARLIMRESLYDKANELDGDIEWFDPTKPSEMCPKGMVCLPKTKEVELAKKKKAELDKKTKKCLCPNCDCKNRDALKQKLLAFAKAIQPSSQFKNKFAKQLAKAEKTIAQKAEKKAGKAAGKATAADAKAKAAAANAAKAKAAAAKLSGNPKAPATVKNAANAAAAKASTKAIKLGAKAQAADDKAAAAAAGAKQAAALAKLPPKTAAVSAKAAPKPKTVAAAKPAA